MSTTNKRFEFIEYDFDSFYMLHNNMETDSYNTHYHDAVEIIMPIRNTCITILDDNIFNLNEFDILIIPSGKEHSIISPPEIGQRIILQFDAVRLSVLRSLTDVFCVYSNIRIIRAEEVPEPYETIKSLLISMLNEYLLQKPYYQVSITNKIIELTLLLARTLQVDKNLHDDKEKIIRFQKCIEYIHKYHTENLPLERVAKAVNFSKFHFSRWFQQLAGVTFYEYLVRLRLRKAEVMLSSSDWSITEIAMSVGFQSTSTFNRIFRSEHQCTPTQYRRLRHRYGSSVETNHHFETKQKTHIHSYIYRNWHLFDSSSNNLTYD